MSNLDLTYRTHFAPNGRELLILPCYDVGENEGGLYCEVYDRETDDVIDNFVVHSDENADEVARQFMYEHYYNNITTQNN
jgi:hypothetical protein